MTGARRARAATVPRTAGGRTTAARRGRPANASTDDTIAAVLTAARRLFATQGYAGTSIRQVAAAAGLAHTAIYNHFGSKAQLFTAVFVDVQDRVVAELVRSSEAGAVTSAGAPALPLVLLDAFEALRAADPSTLEFLASMYVEVRRHPELRANFRDHQPFPIVAVLRDFTGGVHDADAPTADADGTGATGAEDDAMWFWVAFALGAAQLGALADAEGFGATLAALRRHLATHAL